MSPIGITGFAHGETVFVAGTHGQCWRIHQGAVSLSRRDGEDEQFAGLARTGDLIGVEALLGQANAFSAHALSDVQLAPCGELDSHALLAALIASEERSAEALALCRGTADERISRLMHLLAQPTAGAPVAGSVPGRLRLAMPSLREMADITNLTQETVSRVLSRLRRLGQLVRNSRQYAELVPGYLLKHRNSALGLAA